MSNKHLSWLLGTGIILFIWHNPYQPLLQYAFLPWIGILLIILVIGIVYKKYRPLPVGNLKVWLPLLIIALSIILSGITKQSRNESDINNTLGIISISIVLFMIYPVSKLLGKDIFTPFAYAIPIEVTSIVLYGATHNWTPNGGLLSPTNYDIAIGLMIFGLLVSRPSYQTFLTPIVIIGVLFSGAAEGLFSLATLATIWTIKNRKGILYNKLFHLNTAIVTLTICITLLTYPDFLSKIWQNNLIARAFAATQAITDSTDRQSLLYFASGQRIGDNWTISNLLPFGHGYNISNFYRTIPHNIILIIIEQVGILAALSWLYISLRGIKYLPYLWIGFISLGIFDHFIWTQAAPWFWCIAGVTQWKEII